MSVALASVAQEWLNREQAATYIERRTGVPITASVLANRASLGGGPAYSMWGERGRKQRGGRGCYAVYRPEDLDAWIAAQIVEPARRREPRAEARPGYFGV